MVNCEYFLLSVRIISLAVDDFNCALFYRPDTAAFVQRLEREREARDSGETKDQRGFFARYWMYIIPVAVLVLISGSAGSEQSSSGSGR